MDIAILTVLIIGFTIQFICYKRNIEDLVKNQKYLKNGLDGLRDDFDRHYNLFKDGFDEVGRELTEILSTTEKLKHLDISINCFRNDIKSDINSKFDLVKKEIESEKEDRQSDYRVITNTINETRRWISKKEKQWRD